MYLRQKKRVRSAYERIKIHKSIPRSISYAKRVAAETKPRRQHSTHKKKTGWNKRCPNRNRKREGREEKIKNKATSTTQERRLHARWIRILQARKERGGCVAPRRNTRITESATKESREAKRKAKKAIQATNRKRQDERTERTKKEQGRGAREHGKRQKGEEKTKKRKKRKEKRKKTKWKRQGCPSGTTLITWVATVKRMQPCPTFRESLHNFLLYAIPRWI